MSKKFQILVSKLLLLEIDNRSIKYEHDKPIRAVLSRYVGTFSYAKAAVRYLKVT